ncbi:MAG: SDR family NAD(P)-dependent oxidoreductase, partial [Moorea sp. SIO2I5]|nr:SDR family NAD(P)-dependent oxidoreductase [Moorena sp. SIO2I5]
YPSAAAELTLLNRCASQLAEVLLGKVDPLQLVFPEGDLTAAAELYQQSPGAKFMNALVVKTIEIALEKLPKLRGVRVLEIGAGTGGTTRCILPHLNPAQTEYVFTDVGALFTTHARQKFQDYSFVKYQTLDIEINPSTQGFEPHSYDLIVGANVLHATADLHNTLRNVRNLLAPGGMLVLLEGTTRISWMDLIFGLLEGWWKFSDVDLRPNYPLMSSSQWEQLLRHNGFPQVTTTGSEVLSQQSVIIAQAEEKLLLSAARNWLILADSNGVGERLATQLRSLGELPTLVKPGQEYQQVAPQEYVLDPENPADYQKLVTTIPNLYGIVQCWNLDEEEPAVAAQRGCASTLSLVQGLFQAKLSPSPRLWLVTCGAAPVPSTDPLIPGVGQGSWWGMGKTIALEHPELKTVLLDLDPLARNEEQAQTLWAEIWSEDREDQVAFRESNRYVARLTRSRQSVSHLPLSLNKDGTYLITGGFGGLGLLVARWLVDKGARNLVLVGRSGAKEKSHQVEDLEQAGAKVVVAQADVSDFQEIARVISEIDHSLPPLRGAIHAVGVLDDGVLPKMTQERFAKVMAPKVQGAWNLHKLTENQPLDFFVLFSSIASLLGSVGQANHAAANAFLDALAHYRRARGLSGLSINWGVVTKIGSAASRQADIRVLQKGMGTIAPQQVLEALELLMLDPAAVEVGVMPIRWSEVLQQWEDRPFLADWKEISVPGEFESEFFQELLAAETSERRELLVTLVCSQVAKVLGLNPLQPIELEQGFFELGMDSLTSVELRNRLQKNLGVSIPSTAAFDYPTVGELVDYLAQQLGVEFVDFTAVALKDDIKVKHNSREDLSDEETEALLISQLDELGY